MTRKQILDFAKKNVHMAVYIEWADQEDWHFFRIERVGVQEIALTGMTDDQGNQHRGEFFWVEASEIYKIELRN